MGMFNAKCRLPAAKISHWAAYGVLQSPVETPPISPKPVVPEIRFRRERWPAVRWRIEAGQGHFIDGEYRKHLMMP
jgi:hypothetical protein